MHIWRGNLKLAISRCKFSDHPEKPFNDKFYFGLFISCYTGGLTINTSTHLMGMSTLTTLFCTLGKGLLYAGSTYARYL
jgi:hypothetical protein